MNGTVSVSEFETSDSQIIFIKNKRFYGVKWNISCKSSNSKPSSRPLKYSPRFQPKCFNYHSPNYIIRSCPMPVKLSWNVNGLLKKSRTSKVNTVRNLSTKWLRWELHWKRNKNHYYTNRIAWRTARKSFWPFQ